MSLFQRGLTAYPRLRESELTDYMVRMSERASKARSADEHSERVDERVHVRSREKLSE